MSTLTPTAPGKTTIINESVRPPQFADHDAFRRWAREERPEVGRYAYFAGTVWVDLTTEQEDTHNDIKAEIAAALRPLARGEPKGWYRTDGMLVTHPGAGLTTVPDGCFYFTSTKQAGRVVRVPNARGVGCVELQGTVDMVLEVVSESSVEKDTITLPALHHAAGVPEFWRANALRELRFEIFRREEHGYVLSQPADGWCRSAVFGRDFRLTVELEGDRPCYTLEHRPIA